jgi:hypothetical protein
MKEPMLDAQELNLETDDRFPSGPWVGFFLDGRVRQRQWMELGLTFVNGRMSGWGRDAVGKFGLTGSYDLEAGKCRFRKTYIGRHTVGYDGHNEGRGVWGVWEIAEDNLKGGFHIWPKSMGDPTGGQLTEEEELPVEESTRVLIGAGLDDV